VRLRGNEASITDRGRDEAGPVKWAAWIPVGIALLIVAGMFAIAWRYL
jgi:hypothetical protein